MNLAVPSACPRTEDLSALTDGELTGRARDELAAHAAECPSCGAMLRDLSGLRVALQSLADAKPGIDLAPAIGQRLAARRRPSHPEGAHGRHTGWRLVPSGFAVAGVLAAGVYLGALLVGGTGMAVTQPAAMAMFDPVPPGGVCAGAGSCYPTGW